MPGAVVSAYWQRSNGDDRVTIRCAAERLVERMTQPCVPQRFDELRGAKGHTTAGPSPASQARRADFRHRERVPQRHPSLRLDPGNVEYEDDEMSSITIRALVVEEKHGPFLEQELQLEEIGRASGRERVESGVRAA